ncbi:hypothetical protein [Methylorubrum populi]|uniref:hypothetical protein n=1 Tax=Methylorubrum populi TaxID=223967 RepID=UPI002356ABDB|nr:hypothetical protein [Methylorubrum populi]
MLRRIHLHGTLKSIHPEPIEVHAASPAEALKAITRQIPGFGGNAITGPLRIKVLGHETVEDLIAPGGGQDLHLFPQLNGGKNGGFFQILIGAVLVAASFIAGPVIGPILLKVGIVMVLGGILQMFQQPARDKKDSVEKKSHYLGPPKNTVEIGTRIPVLCGEDLVGGHYLSFQIDAVDTGVV